MPRPTRTGPQKPDPSDPLVRALAAISAPGSFCARRHTQPDALALEVVGVGRVRLPLDDATAERIVAMASVSPFGWRERTLVDPAVRDSFEVPAQRVALGGAAFEDLLAEQLGFFQRALGLPSDSRLSARLDKLLLYRPGQFFKPHQDSEKDSRMIGTLVLRLPSSFTGGELLIEHRGQQVAFAPDPGHAAELEWIAFYGDCRHEVRRIESGLRAVLTFRLQLDLPQRGGARRSAPVGAEEQTDPALEAALRARFDASAPAAGAAPPEKAVVLLDHEYTRARLGWDELKGSDRARAAALRAAARAIGLVAHLALAVEYELWDCEESSKRSGRRHHKFRDDDPKTDQGQSAYVLIETLDSHITLTAWHQGDGPLPAEDGLKVTPSELVCTAPTDRAAPTRSEYEGYMGNYGNTLERWYERAAVVLWPLANEHLIRAKTAPFAVIAELTRSLGSDERDVARQKFKALLERWPKLAPVHLPQPHELTLLEAAVALDDAQGAAQLLDAVRFEALREETVGPLAQLGERHGADWVIARCEAWFSAERWSSTWSKTSPEVVRSWQRRESEVGALVAARLAEGRATECSSRAARAPRVTGRWTCSTSQVDARTEELGAALELCALTGLQERVAELLGHLRGRGAQGSPIPSAATLLKARAALARERGTSEAIDRALAELRRELAALHAEPPRSPGDLRIGPCWPCACAQCAGVREFLSSNASEETLALVAESREHIQALIAMSDLPVATAVLAVGRPYKLVLKKDALALGRIEAQDRQALTDVLQALAGLQTERGGDAVAKPKKRPAAPPGRPPGKAK